MPTNLDHLANQLIAARRASNTTPQELLAALNHAENSALHSEEHAKAHALSTHLLPIHVWRQFVAHMRDGGGVLDDSQLHTDLLHAMLNDDQETFWHLLPHVVKSWLKQRGRIQPIPGGSIINGAGPALTPPQKKE